MLLSAQEFNIEKLQLLETEKAKIRKEFERREGTIEVKKKMWAPGYMFHSLCLAPAPTAM